MLHRHLSDGVRPPGPDPADDGREKGVIFRSGERMSKVCYLIDPEEMLKACQQGDLPRVRQLLASDTTLVNAKGSHNKTPLHWAADMGSRDVVKVLLAHGAAPQLNMWAAAGLGMLDVVQSFWDSASPN